MNKSESKYFNTAVRMDEALISLLEKKDFDYITVKEICEAAQVNRSTFYLHYENTTELLFIKNEYLVPYLNFVKENQKFFLAASSKPEVFESNIKYDKMYTYLFEPILERFAVAKAERKYVASFYIHGIMGIITEWTQGGCKEDILDISGIIIKLIMPEEKME